MMSHAVWLSHRFCLSFREVKELLAERGIPVTSETVRQWCQKFGPDYARQLNKRQGRLGDTWLYGQNTHPALRYQKTRVFQWG